MSNALVITLALLIPFLGTTLGSATVFFLKKEINPKLQKALMGFASGVMVAAAFWSLLSPAISSYPDGSFKKWLVPAIGFVLGVGFMLLLDYLIPHIHLHGAEEGVKNTKLSRTFKFFLAVTLHNIPEGMAIRSGFCRSSSRKYRNYNGSCYSFINWNSNTKFSRRSNYFYAT